MAAAHLAAQGLTVLDRNWRCRDGELDLVVRDGTVLVFVEVKTRSSLTFGTPAEGVNRLKIARIRKLALCWMAANRDSETSWTSVRFDVIGVVRRSSGGPSIDHVRGAF